MSERHAGATGARLEAQLMSPDDTLVYEAIATLRRPVHAAEIAAVTGLDPVRIRTALAHLDELGMTVNRDSGVCIGPHDWDVRGAQ
jgi:malate/lactate dehydrogenase